MSAAKPDIRFCTGNDINRVAHFLDTHWAKGHVLAHDRTLMDWQHHDKSKGRHSFVIADRPDSTELDAILGFITTRQYDADLESQNTVWLTTWMVNPTIKAGGLGMRIARFLQQHEPHALIGTVGNNQAVAPVYKALGYTIGELDRYVVINPTKKSFTLLSGVEKPLPPETTPATVTVLTSTDLARPAIQHLIEKTAAPHKSATYLKNRYLNHPRYQYSLLGIYKPSAPDAPIAIAVTRECTAAPGSSPAIALRIVDWFGEDDAIPATGSAISTYIQNINAEYADFYVHGIHADAFAQGPWCPVNPDGTLIVPNYFEPFEQSNPRIRFAVRAQGELPTPTRLFKADADQDRPNQPAEANPVPQESHAQ